jgi:hypothetical protein
MDKHILRRIKSHYPLSDIIVKQSTPVLSFGDFQMAEVFTLGINPSNLEFEDNKGELLKNNLRRLQTYSSITTIDHSSLSEDSAQKILEGCLNSFSRRPYKKWFDKFNPILKEIGFSYTSHPFAAHVDLVQWATKTKWGELTPDQKKILIEDGGSFLEYQLDSDSLKMILLNGRTVIDSFKEWSDVELNKTQFEIRQGRNIDIVTGMYKNRVRIIGWSLNIQSSYGVSKEDIEYLASKVQSLFDFPSST